MLTHDRQGDGGAVGKLRARRDLNESLHGRCLNAYVHDGEAAPVFKNIEAPVAARLAELLRRISTPSCPEILLWEGKYSVPAGRATPSRTLDGVGLPPEAVMPPKPPMPEQPLRKNSRAIIGSVTSGRCIL